jgi:hypothetical protein
MREERPVGPAHRLGKRLKGATVLRRTARRDRALALFAAGVLLFNPPIIGLFSGTVLGLPTLYLYFFVVWALIIVAIALIVESGDQPSDPDRDPPPR